MRLVYIALGWTAGIILAANSTTQFPLIWLALVVLALIAAGLLWRDWRILALTLVAFTLGGLRFSLVPTTSLIAAYNNLGGLTIEGVVVDEPDIRDYYTILRVAAETVTRAGSTVPTEGLVLVRAQSVADAQYGDRVRATGLLITPAEFDTFSYADYLARSGVFSIMSRASVEVLSSGHGSPLNTTLLTLKHQASSSINHALPEPAAGLLNGILLGDESSIAPEIRDAFAVTGAAHLLAISGFNMVVLARVMQGLFRGKRRLAATAGILSIVIYTLLVGATPPVLRAALMSGLLVIGESIRRKTFVPTSLAFAVIVLSLINPTALWEIGFQLSFFATLGLALLATPLTERIDRLIAQLFPASVAGFLRNLLSEPLGVSLAAQLSTIPLTALYFGQLSLASLVVNLLVVPVQPAILIVGGLATMIAFFVFPLAQALYWITLVPLAWTAEVVRWFAAMPNAQIEFGIDPRLVLLFFAVLIGWGMAQATQPEWLVQLARFIRSRVVQTSTVMAGICVIVLTGAVAASRPDGMLHVWLLDVGGYNAVLAQTPHGAHYLIDGGNFPSRLLTALGHRLPFNDREIEVVAITQPDEANFRALSAALERYNARIVLTNGQPNLGEAWTELQTIIGNTEQIAVTAGYTLEADDGTLLEVLHPQEQPTIDDNLDDGTLVLRLSYGEVSFLLTSDTSRAAQQTLLEAGQLPLATVLQLPRGGATLDEGFFAATQAQLVVMQNNSASRQENPDVLALVGNTPLFRTDQGGTIHLWTDGHNLWSVQER
ncbi:MAG TPA: ComEC/Rec2 family competence protein [Oceanobacillus sp.]|nr:ComEC/Rec2 family competence protein [Oceanobacillus sp.]